MMNDWWNIPEDYINRMNEQVYKNMMYGEFIKKRWAGRPSYGHPGVVESTATKVSSQDWTYNDDVESVCKSMGLPPHMFEEKVKTPPLFEIVDAEWSEIDE
jgi:hypothetical protein